MRTFEFKIEYPATKAGKTAWNRQYGLNAYYSGKAWPVRKKDAEYWHALTRHAILREGMPVMFENPVINEYYFNDNLDSTNHAAEVKMIEDGMKGLIIVDDNRKYVQGTAMYFHDEDYILVRVKEVKQNERKNKGGNTRVR
ncbi:MAG: hypothetical protein ACI3XQ_03080 [Eubacteriales bacterium]